MAAAPEAVDYLARFDREVERINRDAAAVQARFDQEVERINRGQDPGL